MAAIKLWESYYLAVNSNLIDLVVEVMFLWGSLGESGKI